MTNEFPALNEQLDGAKVIEIDKARDLFLAWFGGHGIHAYGYDGTEVSFWNVGDWSKNNATEGEVRRSMKAKIRNGNYA